MAIAVALYHVASWLPPAAPRLLLRSLAALARVAYWLPRNPLRMVFEEIAAIANAEGYRHDAQTLYHRMVSQFLAVAEGFLEVFHHGPGPAVRRTWTPPEDLERILALVHEGRGVVLAVGHNVGAVFSSMWITSHVPTVLVSKNQKLPALEVVANDVYRRMAVDVQHVRQMGAVELARVCLGALRKGRILVATLDLLRGGKTSHEVEVFGQKAPLPTWAHRFAMKTGAPIVPTWLEVEPSGRARVHFGPALRPGTVEESVAAFGRFLEANALRDPSSWAFVLDKRWRRALRNAYEALPRR